MQLEESDTRIGCLTASRVEESHRDVDIRTHSRDSALGIAFLTIDAAFTNLSCVVRDEAKAARRAALTVEAHDDALRLSNFAEDLYRRQR